MKRDLQDLRNEPQAGQRVTGQIWPDDSNDFKLNQMTDCIINIRLQRESSGMTRLQHEQGSGKDFAES